MAQGSKPRHSKSTRKPVTIDLPPEEVSGKTGDTPQAGPKPTGAAKPAAAATADKDGKSDPAAGRKETAVRTGSDAKADAVPKAETGKPGAETSHRADTAPKAQTGKSGADSSDKTKPAASVPKAGAAKDSPAASAPVAEKPSTTSSGDRKDTMQAAAKPSSGSAGRTFGVGVAAAVVAVLLFGGLQYAGVLPVPGGGSGGNVSDIVAADIDALKQTVTSLEQRATGDSGDALQDLQSRLAALESSAASGAGDIGGRLDAVEGRVEALASSGTDGQPAASTDALQALETRVAAIEAAQSGEQGSLQDVTGQLQSATGEIQSVTGQLGDITGKLTALEQSVSDQQSALQTVQGTLSTIDQKISSEAQSREDAVKAIDGRLSAVEGSLAEPRQDVRVAQTLAAANLKAAIDRGGPFMAELEAYASVAGDSPVVAPLRTLAASGVPTRATLLSRFPAAANAMIDATRDGSSGNVFDRLMDSASSLVTVRPVGEVTGDSVEAIVARMENRLKNGNLQGAVDEWNTLPQASKDASQGYVGDLKARIEAERLVTGSLNAALPAATQSGENN